MASSLSAKLEPIIGHIKTCFDRHRSLKASPLFVAFQGPQGSGKTFTTSQLRGILKAPPHNLSVTVLSIDDFYLPHSRLVVVAAAHPENKLLSGRGPPGTHDVALGTTLLSQLKAINEPEASVKELTLPFFDKSLFDGEGDRVEGGGEVVRPPVDIVLFEGWFVGFCPVSEEEINRRYEEPVPDLQGTLDIKSFRKEDIVQLNGFLRDYVDWWAFFDVFVQLKPPNTTPYSPIYKWRLEQEHNMKAKNGGKGMTDEQVKKFVDRYIPGYVFFSDGVDRGWIDSSSGERHFPTWTGSGLKVSIDENRDLVSVEKF